jgi:hypothetical protein
MEAKLEITQSPQTLAGAAIRPAVPTLKKLTSILAAHLGPMRLRGLVASILAPTPDAITQAVQHSRTLSSREKMEFPLYLTRW